MRVKLELIGDCISGLGNLTLVRAGKIVYGSGTLRPEAGWFSPTYTHKIPGLTLSYSTTSQLPLRIHSQFEFLEK